MMNPKPSLEQKTKEGLTATTTMSPRSVASNTVEESSAPPQEPQQQQQQEHDYHLHKYCNMDPPRDEQSASSHSMKPPKPPRTTTSVKDSKYLSRDERGSVSSRKLRHKDGDSRSTRSVEDGASGHSRRSGHGSSHSRPSSSSSRHHHHHHHHHHDDRRSRSSIDSSTNISTSHRSRRSEGASPRISGKHASSSSSSSGRSSSRQERTRSTRSADDSGRVRSRSANRGRSEGGSRSHHHHHHHHSSSSSSSRTRRHRAGEESSSRHHHHHHHHHHNNSHHAPSSDSQSVQTKMLRTLREEDPALRKERRRRKKSSGRRERTLSPRRSDASERRRRKKEQHSGERSAELRSLTPPCSKDCRGKRRPKPKQQQQEGKPPRAPPSSNHNNNGGSGGGCYSDDNTYVQLDDNDDEEALMDSDHWDSGTFDGQSVWESATYTEGQWDNRSFSTFDAKSQQFTPSSYHAAHADAHTIGENFSSYKRKTTSDSSSKRTPMANVMTFRRRNADDEYCASSIDTALTEATRDIEASGSSEDPSPFSMAELMDSLQEQQLDEEESNQVFCFAPDIMEKIEAGTRQFVFIMPQVSSVARFSTDEFKDLLVADVLKLSEQRPFLVDVETEEVAGLNEGEGTLEIF